MYKGARFSTGLWTWSSLADRFTTAGYRENYDGLRALEEAAKLKDLDGVELTYPDSINEENLPDMKVALAQYGLQVASIYNNISSHPKWQRGALTSSEATRREAIAHAKRCMDICAELNCPTMTFSILQDGHDYSFQSDFLEDWKNIVASLQEIADYNPNVKIALEYKSQEPRIRIILGNVYSAVLLANEVNRVNVGVTVDVGHALNAGENMAQSCALLAMYGKMFHTHLNDNYRKWDDDLIVGSVHFIEYLELFYWLRRCNYSGWYGLDIFPYREDPGRACEESIAFIKKCFDIIDAIGMEQLGELIKKKDIPETLKKIREVAFK